MVLRNLTGSPRAIDVRLLQRQHEAHQLQQYHHRQQHHHRHRQPSALLPAWQQHQQLQESLKHQVGNSLERAMVLLFSQQSQEGDGVCSVDEFRSGFARVGEVR